MSGRVDNALATLEAEIQRVLDAAPRADFVRIPLHIAATCRSGLYAIDEIERLRARVAELEATVNEWAGV